MIEQMLIVFGFILGLVGIIVVVLPWAVKYMEWVDDEGWKK